MSLLCYREDSKYERPADQSDAVQVKRAGYGEEYLKKYGGGVSEKSVSGGMTNADCPFLVRVTAKDLNIRNGAGTDFDRVKYIPVGTYTIVEVKSGKGSRAGWGKLKSGIGFISLDYVTRV